MMKSQAESLQAQLDFQRAKTQEFSNKLMSYEMREDDSDYQMKAEYERLQNMVAHWIQHSSQLEKKFAELKCINEQFMREHKFPHSPEKFTAASEKPL